jgi:hypothetical protein
MWTEEQTYGMPMSGVKFVCPCGSKDFVETETMALSGPEDRKIWTLKPTKVLVCPECRRVLSKDGVFCFESMDAYEMARTERANKKMWAIFEETLKIWEAKMTQKDGAN